MANSEDPDQIASIEAVCSESTLFAFILNSPVMLGIYLQQMTSAGDIFRCIFSWVFRRKYTVIKLVLSGRAVGGRAVGGRAARSWFWF